MATTTTTQHQPIPPPNYSSPSSAVQTPTTPPVDSHQPSPSSPQAYWGLNNVSRQPKQIRTPRAPLYVPAVLRPTEKPLRSSPPSGAFAAPQFDSATPSQHQLNTSSQSESPALRRMVTEEWLESSMGKVSGPPSRNHWKTDASSYACDSPACERSFSLLNRRHHCRRCGSIFCADHSPHHVPLDQHARFHPLAQQYRACDDCFKDFKVWETERLRRANDAASETDDSASMNQASINVIAKPTESTGVINTLAQSVPGNWNWSTF